MLRRTVLAAGAAACLPGCGVVASSRGAAARRAQGPSPAQWARTAWRYVENNTDLETGLVSGIDRFPTFTAWNAGDALASVVAAHELGVIEAREFDLRLSRLLGFLAAMDLSGGQMPNKAYSAATGKMVNFGNQPEDIGWSAVDSGRLLLWLKIVGQRHPRFREYADKVVLRWSFCNALDACGTLRGSVRAGGQLQHYQEGRYGYEQLAAAGYAAWGFDTRASGPLPRLETVNILGRPVRYDARDPRVTGVAAPVLTMPHVYLGMELGWEPPGGGGGFREAAQEVFAVQEERWRRERQFTARSDYQRQAAPYVVLDSVYAAGYPWNTVAPDGTEHEKLALVSTRAAFGMWALWPGDYTSRLIEAVQWLHDPDRGWYEGRLEAGGAPHSTITLSTNAAILEALLFQSRGRLYPAGAGRGYFEVRTQDVFERTGRCLPGERAACDAAVR
ncbi:MAG TPA: DUF3131 domain-containing protein [Ramlibacter sp.]|nr:DUF3131 domain-containing protein [Ramlibacter sp.]